MMDVYGRIHHRRPETLSTFLRLAKDLPLRMLNDDVLGLIFNPVQERNKYLNFFDKMGVDALFVQYVERRQPADMVNAQPTILSQMSHLFTWDPNFGVHGEKHFVMTNRGPAITDDSERIRTECIYDEIIDDLMTFNDKMYYEYWKKHNEDWKKHNSFQDNFRLEYWKKVLKRRCRSVAARDLDELGRKPPNKTRRQQRIATQLSRGWHQVTGRTAHLAGRYG